MIRAGSSQAEVRGPEEAAWGLLGWTAQAGGRGEGSCAVTCLAWGCDPGWRGGRRAARQVSHSVCEPRGPRLLLRMRWEASQLFELREDMFCVGQAPSGREQRGCQEAATVTQART